MKTYVDDEHVHILSLKNVQDLTEKSSGGEDYD